MGKCGSVRQLVNVCVARGVMTLRNVLSHCCNVSVPELSACLPRQPTAATHAEAAAVRLLTRLRAAGMRFHTLSLCLTEERDGRCPALMCPVEARKCAQDGECLQDEKCCATSCGRSCVKALYTGMWRHRWTGLCEGSVHRYVTSSLDWPA